jgi:tetratricopeptide (TPR) repeat protein
MLPSHRQARAIVRRKAVTRTSELNKSAGNMARLDLLFQQACSLHERGDLVQAKNQCEKILVAQPAHVETLNRLGMIAGQSGDLKHAVELFAQVTVHDPNHVAATYNMATAFYNMGRFNAALAVYNRAIEIKPDFAQAYFSRGNVLRDLRQLSNARDSFERAIALDGDNEEFYVNFGNVLRDLGEWDAALLHYARAIELKEDCAEAHQCRGVALMELQQLPAALNSFERAISWRPDDAAAHCCKAYALLSAGDFERGWAEYEWRRKDENGPVCKDQRHFSQPLWLGEQSISGRTILLHGEQGLGDTLQFCRYVTLVADLGARVILEVPEPLSSLLACLEGPSQIVARGSELPEFEYQCSLLSLPLALRTTLATIPARVPYLRAGADRLDYWQRILGGRSKPRVGLVWSGGFRPHQPELWGVNSRRNIPLAKFAHLKNAGIEFYSLQKGQLAEAELAELVAKHWDGPEIRDHTSELHNFADTAALIELLDLVISVDTSTAHLAAALGKPVWLLNRFDTCWRWMTHRTDSPWYPTLKLYRQPRPGDWDSVVQNVKTDLMQLAH